jgi:predicted membrane GTPase involved in stress response
MMGGFAIIKNNNEVNRFQLKPLNSENYVGARTLHRIASGLVRRASEVEIHSVHVAPFSHVSRFTVL